MDALMPHLHLISIKDQLLIIILAPLAKHKINKLKLPKFDILVNFG